MNKKILVIDDDKLVLRSLQSLLQRAGYDVFCAADGEAVDGLVKQHSFNLIVSDIRMPGDGGIAITTRIKEYFKLNGKQEVPFLFMTGYASEDAPIDAIKLGARDYLLKPFDINELLKSVQKNIS